MRIYALGPQLFTLHHAEQRGGVRMGAAIARASHSTKTKPCRENAERLCYLQRGHWRGARDHCFPLFRLARFTI